MSQDAGSEIAPRKIPEAIRAVATGVRLEKTEREKWHTDRAFDGATIRGLLEFAEEEEKVSVRLLKKRGEEE